MRVADIADPTFSVRAWDLPPPNGTDRVNLQKDEVFGPILAYFVSGKEVQYKLRNGRFTKPLWTRWLTVRVQYYGEERYINVWCDRNKSGKHKSIHYAFPCSTPAGLTPANSPPVSGSPTPRDDGDALAPKDELKDELKAESDQDTKGAFAVKEEPEEADDGGGEGGAAPGDMEGVDWDAQDEPAPGYGEPGAGAEEAEARGEDDGTQEGGEALEEQPGAALEGPANDPSLAWVDLPLFEDKNLVPKAVRVRADRVTAGLLAPVFLTFPDGPTRISLAGDPPHMFRPSGDSAAVVTTVDPTGASRGSVDEALVQAAGDDLSNARMQIFTVDVSDGSATALRVTDVVDTGAGNLHTQLCLHAVTPSLTEYGGESEGGKVLCSGILVEAYRKVYAVAKKRNITALALPIFGADAGTGHLGPFCMHDLAHIAVLAATRYSYDALLEVFLCAHSDDMKDVLMELACRLVAKLPTSEGGGGGRGNILRHVRDDEIRNSFLRPRPAPKAGPDDGATSDAPADLSPDVMAIAGFTTGPRVFQKQVTSPAEAARARGITRTEDELGKWWTLLPRHHGTVEVGCWRIREMSTTDLVTVVEHTRSLGPDFNDRWLVHSETKGTAHAATRPASTHHDPVLTTYLVSEYGAQFPRTCSPKVDIDGYQRELANLVNFVRRETTHQDAVNRAWNRWITEGDRAFAGKDPRRHTVASLDGFLVLAKSRGLLALMETYPGFVDLKGRRGDWTHLRDLPRRDNEGPQYVLQIPPARSTPLAAPDLQRWEGQPLAQMSTSVLIHMCEKYRDCGPPAYAYIKQAVSKVRGVKGVDVKNLTRETALRLLVDRLGSTYPAGGMLLQDYDPQQAAYSDAVAYLCGLRENLKKQWQRE